MARRSATKLSVKSCSTVAVPAKERTASSSRPGRRIESAKRLAACCASGSGMACEKLTSMRIAIEIGRLVSWWKDDTSCGTSFSKTRTSSRLRVVT
jgi:hypothetical protein